MIPFAYHRPSSVAGAAKILGDCEDPKLLAGGMTLLPTLKQRLAAPSDLIDLGLIRALQGIRMDGKQIVVGAMTRHADVAASPDVAKAIPALAYLAGQIGDPAVRHRGTIGGSTSNADPAADYPAGVVGLDAEIETNQRRINADDFFTGLFETALEPGEILTSVRFRAPDAAHYLKVRHPASGYAVVGIMVARYGKDVRVGVTGAGPNVFRLSAFEEALSAKFSVDAIADLAVDPSELLSDMHASAAYRANIVSVLTRRAVTIMA